MPLLGFETIRIMSCSIFTVQQNMALLWKHNGWIMQSRYFQYLPVILPQHACFKPLLQHLSCSLWVSLNSLSEIWFGIMTEFSTISEIALNLFLLFYAACLCNVAVSSLTSCNQKNQSALKTVEKWSITVSNSQLWFNFYVKSSTSIFIINMHTFLNNEW